MNKVIAVKLIVTILWVLFLLHQSFFSIIPDAADSRPENIPVAMLLLLYFAWFIPVSLIAAKAQVKQEYKNCFLSWLFRIRRKAGEI